jgi:hypothetical protein
VLARIVLSVGLIGATLAISLRVSNLNRATVALMMVLVIVGIAHYVASEAMDETGSKGTKRVEY